MLLDGYCGNTVAWMGNVRAAVFFLFIRNWLYGMMQYDNQATVLTQGICHDIIILNLWE